MALGCETAQARISVRKPRQVLRKILDLRETMPGILLLAIHQMRNETRIFGGDETSDGQHAPPIVRRCIVDHLVTGERGVSRHPVRSLQGASLGFQGASPEALKAAIRRTEHEPFMHPSGFAERLVTTKLRARGGGRRTLLAGLHAVGARLATGLIPLARILPDVSAAALPAAGGLCARPAAHLVRRAPR